MQVSVPSSHVMTRPAKAGCRLADTQIFQAGIRISQSRLTLTMSSLIRSYSKTKGLGSTVLSINPLLIDN
jgi:hypothetical protein